MSGGNLQKIKNISALLLPGNPVNMACLQKTQVRLQISVYQEVGVAVVSFLLLLSECWSLVSSFLFFVFSFRVGEVCMPDIVGL